MLEHQITRLYFVPVPEKNITLRDISGRQSFSNLGHGFTQYTQTFNHLTHTFTEHTHSFTYFTQTFIHSHRIHLTTLHTKHTQIIVTSD